MNIDPEALALGRETEIKNKGAWDKGCEGLEPGDETQSGG